MKQKNIYLCSIKKIVLFKKIYKLYFFNFERKCNLGYTREFLTECVKKTENASNINLFSIKNIFFCKKHFVSIRVKTLKTLISYHNKNAQNTFEVYGLMAG